jgi:hypothetical protein
MSRSPCVITRVHQHLPHSRAVTLRIDKVNSRSRLPIDPEAGWTKSRLPASALPPQPRTRNPRQYVHGHSALSVVARSNCGSHPFLRRSGWCSPNFSCPSFALVRISISADTATAPTRGEALPPQASIPKRRRIAIVQTNFRQRMYLGPGGCTPKPRRFYGGMTAVMHRASSRGVFPQIFAPNANGQAVSPGDAACITRITAQQWRRYAWRDRLVMRSSLPRGHSLWHHWREEQPFQHFVK